MRKNLLKAKLAKKEHAAGSWVSLGHHFSAEVMGLVGFDWLLIDMEHGPGDFMTLLGQVQAIQAAGTTTPIVRVAELNPAIIKRVLDIGAQGVMVPGINTREDAERAIQAVRYPKEGTRGYAACRASRFGLDLDYTKTANDNLAIFLQIEHLQAVENLEDILSVPGFDVAFIGPNDLAASMGHLGNIPHPEVQEKITYIEKTAKQHGIPLGTVTTGWEKIEQLIEKGYLAPSLMGDIALLLSSAKDLLERFRKHPKTR